MAETVVLYRAELPRRGALSRRHTSLRRSPWYVDLSSVAPFAVVVLEDVVVPRGIALCDRLAKRLARYRFRVEELEQE